MLALRRSVASALGRVATIGADPSDNEELAARKALLVAIAVIILPIALVWGSLYLALGTP